MNKANIPQAIPMNSDLNGMLTPGEYYTGGGGESVANTPYTAGSFSLKVEYNGSWGHGVKQIWGSYYGNDTWTRVLDHQSWSPWLRLATATPPEEHDLPLAEGYRPSNYVIYCKSQFGRAYLDIGGIRRTDNALIQSLAVFCTLPSGYRPKREIVRSVDLLDAVGAPAGTGHIHICTNGDVYVTALNSNTYGVMGEYEFWAAS